MSVATKSREVVSQGIAEQLEPVLRLAEAIRAAAPAADPAKARRRLLRGQHALDPNAVIRDGGPLGPGFSEAVKAFERGGIASSSAVTALRQREWNATELAMAWIAGDRAPTEPVARLARRAATLVASAVLARAADSVADEVARHAWDRATCPCCGGSPDFAVVRDAGRMLVCSRCDSTWQAPKPGCLGCGSDGAPTIGRIRSPFLGYTLTICHSCGRYLKERPWGDPCRPLLERALTAELDAAAERRGLRI